MSNHYHLLLETPLANMPQIMQYINGSYTAYFNVRHQRAGHLFQGRYKAILVEADAYAKELSRYIHLNPVRAEIVGMPHEYTWSSFPYYIGRKRPPKWLCTMLILGYFSKRVFGAQNRYREFVNSGVGSEYKTPLKDVVGSTILGSTDFVNDIKERYLRSKSYERELPALRTLRPRPSVELIKKEVNAVLGKDSALSKRVSLYLSRQFSGMRLREIGRHFGVGESGVSQASHRVVVQMNWDWKLKRDMERIQKRLQV
jgi:hypothetical protein